MKSVLLSVLWARNLTCSGSISAGRLNISGATEDGFINVGYTDHYVRVRCIHPRILTDHITRVRLGEYIDDYVQASPVSGG